MGRSVQCLEVIRFVPREKFQVLQICRGVIKKLLLFSCISEV